MVSPRPKGGSYEVDLVIRTRLFNEHTIYLARSQKICNVSITAAFCALCPFGCAEAFCFGTVLACCLSEVFGFLLCAASGTGFLVKVPPGWAHGVERGAGTA